MWFFTPITHDWGWRQLLLPQAFRGFAQQFAVAPTVTLTLGGLAPNRLKLASGLFNLMRNLGGAIGIALIDTILEQRTQGHADHLIAQLQAGRTEAAREVGLPLAQFHNVPLGPIDDITKAIVAPLVKKAALTESFNEAWIAIAILFAISLLALPLMKRAHIPDTAMGPGTEHDTHI
jgi:DHA2 family multidrug resistance protein